MLWQYLLYDTVRRITIKYSELFSDKLSSCDRVCGSSGGCTSWMRGSNWRYSCSINYSSSLELRSLPEHFSFSYRTWCSWVSRVVFPERYK